MLIPPKGYLERLRNICTKHGILLIFDEVITGFGRLGSPFGAGFFGVTPDMITMAKGLTNGAVPMGAVAASDQIYDTFMQGPEGAIELFHGYTYSAHPVACAAAHWRRQEIYRQEGLLARASEMASYWADGVHSLKGLPAQLIDLRNLGLIGAVGIRPDPRQAGPARLGTASCGRSGRSQVRVTGGISARCRRRSSSRSSTSTRCSASLRTC